MKSIQFFKYQGAGNDFILIDNRSNQISLHQEQIKKLCDRHFGIGADGLMLLEKSHLADFKMIYFNADGNPSTMCGNGGRCIVAFAQKLGIIHGYTTFEAIDGLHYAEILSDNTIKLQMKKVTNIQDYQDHFVLDTGSPHYVTIIPEWKDINVVEKGRAIRNLPEFQKNGINVNFMQIKDPNHILVRTYERGVENETLACGTGVTACAIVTAHLHQLNHANIYVNTPGGELQVHLERNHHQYQNIYLIGNAEYVFCGEINIQS